MRSRINTFSHPRDTKEADHEKAKKLLERLESENKGKKTKPYGIIAMESAYKLDQEKFYSIKMGDLKRILTRADAREYLNRGAIVRDLTGKVLHKGDL